MARQMSIIPFTGKLGNIIGYQRNGKFFARSVPEIVRQTIATRRAALRFGMASRKGALIRNAFYDELDINCDSGHINRLNKALIAAGDDHAAITGFRFNQHAGTDRFLTVAPRLFRNEVLHIPSQTIAQHKGITALEVKVIAARIDFITHDVTGTATVTLMIDPALSFNGTDIALDVPGEGTLVVTLQIKGLHKDGASCNRQYAAADIIAISVPQQAVCFNKPTYPQERILQPQQPSDHIQAHAYQLLNQLE